MQCMNSRKQQLHLRTAVAHGRERHSSRRNAELTFDSDVFFAHHQSRRRRCCTDRLARPAAAGVRAAAVWSCHGRLLGNQDWGKIFASQRPKYTGGRAEETAAAAAKRGEKRRQPILPTTDWPRPGMCYVTTYVPGRRDECNKRRVSTVSQSVSQSVSLQSNRVFI